MQSDSTTNLVGRVYAPSVASQQDLPEYSYSPPDPSPGYKSATAGVPKTPPKRLGVALKNEEEIKALQSMMLEETKTQNLKIIERHVKKQAEREKSMQEKYGAVGRIVVRSIILAGSGVIQSLLHMSNFGSKVCYSVRKKVHSKPWSGIIV